MASGGEGDDLECGLCLNIYKNPKFLPCHHTYCEGCLKELANSTCEHSVKCPSCRQQFQLPPGGVSQLQTNFYLTPLLNPERCTLHRAETLRFYCTDCKTPICINCRMTDHFKHDAQDLGKAANKAREELKDYRNRLDETETALRKQLVQLQENIYFSRETREGLKHAVSRRVEQLAAMARECGETLQKELDISFDDQVAHTKRVERRVQSRLSATQDSRLELTQAIDSLPSATLLFLSSYTPSGRGSPQQLRQLTLDLPVHSDRVVIRFDDNDLSRDVISRFLGRLVQFQAVAFRQSVTIKKEFRCFEDPQLYVHAIYIDSILGDILVAYGDSETEGEGWVVRHAHNGKLLYKSPDAVQGRVCLGGLNESYVRVEGKEFPAKDWLSETFDPDGNESATRKYDVHNKGDARFVLRVHESGLCDLRSVTITEDTETADVRVCEVSAKIPIAMDVSKDGRLVAVLEEGQDHVTLYRHGNIELHAIYQGHGEAFRPLDVCFYVIGGEERLVLADWLNDVLHVVEVGESCKLIGHVGEECPELVKPTALCADREGRLWIGCQGGHVLTLSQQ